jgi:predicted membrane metal-binding protein
MGAAICIARLMPSPPAACALAFVAGVGLGVATDVPVLHREPLALCLLVVAAGSACRWLESPARLRLCAAVCAVAGLLHGSDARDSALHSLLRAHLDGTVGHASIDAVGVIGRHEPLRLRARLTEDAADGGDFVSLRVESTALLVGDRWQQVSGGLVVTVSGTTGRERLRQWSTGRVIEAPVLFRRPTRYLDAGVADFERDAALNGITLFASVKSPLLVEVVGRGTATAEWAAAARRGIRTAVTRWVAPYGEAAAAIVTAVLIGDRAGLSDEVRTRLQAAGTYHVIAISGGNIAILAALVIGLLAAVGVRGALASLVAIGALLAHAQGRTRAHRSRGRP